MIIRIIIQPINDPRVNQNPTTTSRARSRDTKGLNPYSEVSSRPSTFNARRQVHKSRVAGSESKSSNRALLQRFTQREEIVEDRRVNWEK